MGRFSQVRNMPGVYVLFDLDDRPVYVGQSRTLQSRLEQHFVRQDSSATADGLLDIYDVLRVAVWYASTDQGFSLEAYEAAAHWAFPLRWNRAVPSHTGPLPDLNVGNADAMTGILDSPEELAVRRQPLELIEAKLLHLVRAVGRGIVNVGADGHSQVGYILDGLRVRGHSHRCHLGHHQGSER